MISPIKAVTFDAAGTLFEVAEPVGITYSRIARSHGVEAGAEDLGREFHALRNQIPSPHIHRIAGTGDFDGHEIERRWWKSFARTVFAKARGKRAPIPRQRFDTLFEDLFEHYAGAGAWRLRPDVPEVLETLQRRVKIGVISNFDRRFHTVARELALEPFFDSVILSSAICASKPDPAIFAAAAGELGFIPSEILHIGDDPVRDWRGAMDAGYQVYRLDPGARPLRDVPAWIDSRS